VVLAVLAELVAVGQVELIPLQMELLTRAAAAVVLEMVRQELMAAQASSSFPTQAHNEALAAQSHQAVATPFTHLHLAVLIQLN
jgi:hypothetical protein